MPVATPLLEKVICDQIVSDLAANLTTFTVDAIADTSPANLSGANATIVRSYLPEYGLEDKGKARITVIPSVNQSRMVARNLIQETYSADINVQKRLIDDDDGDLMSKLVEEIQRYYEREATEVIIAADPKVVFLNAEMVEVYDPERLDEAKEYNATVRLNFTTTRPLYGI